MLVLWELMPGVIDDVAMGRLSYPESSDIEM
jgi:hypothetical protein